MLAPNVRFQQPVRPVVQPAVQGALPADWEQQLQEAYETGYADGVQEANEQCYNVGKKSSSKKGMTFIESVTPKLKILPGVKKRSSGKRS